MTFVNGRKKMRIGKFGMALLSLAVILCLNIDIAEAKKKKKPKGKPRVSLSVFSGTFQGVCSPENIRGESIYYSPIRLDVLSTGAVTGAGQKKTHLEGQDPPDEGIAITGGIGKPKVTNYTKKDRRIAAPITLQASDGAVFQGEIVLEDLPSAGASIKLMDLSVQKEDFIGNCAITHIGF